jgi:hypothetical protein
MKLATFVIPVLALSLAACGAETVKETKETVVEKPMPAAEALVVPPSVTKETIVEPSGVREVIVKRTLPALRSCTYWSGTYSDGSLSCQAGYRYRCDDGAWDSLGRSC